MDADDIRKLLQANERDLEKVSKMELDHVTCDTVHDWTDRLPEANAAITKIEWFQRDSSIIEARIREGLRDMKIWKLSFNAISRKIFQVSITRIADINGQSYPLEKHIMVGSVSRNTKKYCEYYPHGSHKNAVPGEVSHEEFLARGGVDISQWVDAIAQQCATYDECIALFMRDDSISNGIILTCMAEEDTLVACITDPSRHQIIRFIFDGATRQIICVAAYAIMWDSILGQYTQAEHIVAYESDIDLDSINDDEEME